MTLERYNELFIVDFLAGTLHWRIDRRGGARAGDRAGQPVGVTWRKRQQKWHAKIWLDGRMRTILYHADQATAARAFEIVDTMLKDGHTFDDAKAAARRECLPE